MSGGSSMTVGGTVVTAASTVDDIVFGKFDSTGTPLWVKMVGTGTVERANSIAVDAAGNVYICGLFDGTTDFDPSGGGVANLTSAGLQDGFFAKYNTAGDYAWARRIGSSTGDDQCYRICTDGTYVFVGSTFFGTSTFSVRPALVFARLALVVAGSGASSRSGAHVYGAGSLLTAAFGELWVWVEGGIWETAGS